MIEGGKRMTQEKRRRKKIQGKIYRVGNELANSIKPYECGVAG